MAKTSRVGALAVSCSLLAVSCANPATTSGSVLRAAGVEQSVTCSGERTGGTPAVVLLHGIGDQASSEQWREVQEDVAARTRVCRYDRPGAGSSPAPGRAGRGPVDLVAELDAVLDVAASDGPVILVAHSFGGYVALLHAVAHPERVGGLVLVDALPPDVGVVAGTGATTLTSVAMANEQLDLEAVEAAVTTIEALPGDPPMVVMSRGRGTTGAWTTGQERLAALSARSSRSVVPDTGHQVPTEAPEAVVDAVSSLLTTR